mmetsp:Transcript_18079/g.56449  ORF Transcript_18079/g.56449 Transcript_18079/m.56449 type:complete len:176 (+) Transcript_18079:101-628(+)
MCLPPKLETAAAEPEPDPEPAPPSDGGATLFLALWLQCWSLQLLKEANIPGAPPPCAVALALAVAFSASAVATKRRLAEARGALAVIGLWYAAARGSSSNHVLLQALCCVAVLETAFDASRLPAVGGQVLAAIYGVTALAKCNAGWVQPDESCAVLYLVLAPRPSFERVGDPDRS